MKWPGIIFLLFTITAHAQPGKIPVIVKIEERSYKLVQLENGDLVPFVRTGEDNWDVYFKNGRISRKIRLNVVETDTLGYVEYSYEGDSITVTKRYDKDDGYKEKDSSVYDAGGILKRNFKYLFRKGRTETEEEEYFIIDSLQTKIVEKKNGEVDKITLITELGKNRQLNITMNENGDETRRDTITRYEWGDSIRKTVFAGDDDKIYFTRREFSTDQYGNWTSMMVFYNKDTIGDHIECILRDIYYEGKSKVAPPAKEAYYGYWVSVYGNHHYLLKPGGEVNIWRNLNSVKRTNRWAYDEVRKMPYIVLSKEELKDPPRNAEQGNRLYLPYDKKKRELTIGDFECTFRPVLKRRIE